MLILVKPDVKYQRQYMEMLDEWKATGEMLIPWVLQEDHSDFKAMTEKFERYAQGQDVPEGFVPSSTFWAYETETDQIVGAVNIRHWLNDKLLQGGGNIGYGVRPSARRKGYATAILRLALEECKRFDLDKVLLGCNKDNIGSAKTIQNNGGVLENEVVDKDTGKIIQRYWINIKK
jgi:predicted acetyltransferase